MAGYNSYLTDLQNNILQVYFSVLTIVKNTYKNNKNFLKHQSLIVEKKTKVEVEL